MNELKIAINSNVGSISTNFEELKSSLRDQMEVYSSLEVTEDNKKERKADIATLRKIQKAVSSEYSSIRKEFMKPIDALKKSVDELNGIIEEPIRLLDGQVKEFEERQRLEKKHAIVEYFNSKIGDIDISIDQIYDSKWENATTSMKSVKTDIDDMIGHITDNINLINSMSSDKREDAMNNYLATLDIAASLTMINRYEQQKREIEERMKKEQELKQQRDLETERQRIREEERQRIAEEEKIRQQEREKFEQEKQADHEAMAVHRQVSGIKRRVYEIHASEEEFAQIEMYMNSLGLNYMLLGCK